ncbi:unnamed protein product [Amoebophrya sp. A120]|nr:unnamed protein product [Amoebophrya sp. A120]|eukprot:GSA120T00018605001.1
MISESSMIPGSKQLSSPSALLHDSSTSSRKNKNHHRNSFTSPRPAKYKYFIKRRRNEIMYSVSSKRLRGGKGTCRMTNCLLQYSESVPNHGSVAGTFRRVKRYAVRNRIYWKAESPLAPLRWREKPKWAKVRMLEESVYYKKWSFLKYCTEVVKHGIENELPIIDMQNRKTDTASANVHLSGMACDLNNVSEALSDSRRHQISNLALPFRFRPFAGQVPAELSVSEYLESGTLPTSDSFETARVYQLSKTHDNLPKHSRLCTWEAVFTKTQLLKYTEEGVFVKDKFRNVVTRIGLQLPQGGSYNSDSTGVDESLSLAADDRSSCVLLPPGSIVLRTETLPEEESVAVEEGLSSPAFASSSQGAEAQARVQESRSISAKKHVTFLLTEDYHRMLDEEFDSDADGYDVPFLAALPADVGYSEATLVDRWERYWNNDQGADDPVDERQQRSESHLVAQEAAHLQLSAAADSLQSEDAADTTTSGYNRQDNNEASALTSSRTAEQQKEGTELQLRRESIIKPTKSKDFAMFDGVETTRAVGLEARRLRVAAILQEKKRQYKSLMDKDEASCLEVPGGSEEDTISSLGGREASALDDSDSDSKPSIGALAFQPSTEFGPREQVSTEESDAADSAFNRKEVSDKRQSATGS